MLLLLLEFLALTLLLFSFSQIVEVSLLFVRLTHTHLRKLKIMLVIFESSPLSSYLHLMFLICLIIDIKRVSSARFFKSRKVTLVTLGPVSLRSLVYS